MSSSERIASRALISECDMHKLPAHSYGVNAFSKTTCYSRRNSAPCSDRRTYRQGRPQARAGCATVQDPKSLGCQILVELYIYILVIKGIIFCDIGLILKDFAQILRVRPQLASDSCSFSSPTRLATAYILFRPQPSARHKQSNTPSSHHTRAIS
jgi:hypothetical protein